MGLQIYALQVDWSATFPWETFLRCVGKKKRDQLSRLNNQEDRVRGLLADLLVREILTQQWGIPWKQIRLAVNPFGKPFLPRASVQFNVSHSGNWVVAAFDSETIGIDVQVMEPLDYGSLSEYFLTGYECRQIFEKEQSMQLGTFYRFWTGKESYVKAIGEGLSIDLKSFHLSMQDMTIVSRTAENDERWNVRFYDISPHYSLSVCSQSTGFPHQPVLVVMENLIESARMRF